MTAHREVPMAIDIWTRCTGQMAGAVPAGPLWHRKWDT